MDIHTQEKLKCYNFRLKKFFEAIDVKFDEYSFFKSKTEKKYHQIYEIYDKQKMEEESSDIEESKLVKNEILIPTLLQGSTISKTPSKRIQKNHPEEQIMGDINAGVETRSKRREST